MLLLLPSDMLLLQHLLLVALLVAPLGGAPAAPAPSLGVEEEGGRQAEAKLRLPGSIVAPLSRAELFQRPRPRTGSSSMPIQAEVAAELLGRTPRPRSLGGRRLKGGSEVNSLREKAIKAEGSRQGARSQTAIKEQAIKAEGSRQGGNRILLPTRIPKHNLHLISMRQKPHQSSPMILSTGSSQLESAMNPDKEEDENEAELTTILPIDIFDGQYHEVNPGQYNETNPGQYHEANPGQYHEKNPGQYEETDEGKYLEINPGQYEAVVEYNAEEETKSYNVHRKTGDYIIGEVGKININNGQTLEGVRYTAVEGMVNQEQIAEILARYFGTGQR